MAEYIVQDTSLQQIADAIREKAGLEGTLAFPTAMAEAIAAIEAGGGGVGGGGKMATGTVTNSANLPTITLEHGLGIAPSIVFVALTPGLIISNNTSKYYIPFVLYENGNCWYCYCYPKTSALSYTTCDNANINISIDENTFAASITTELRKFASHTYMWVAFGKE